MDCSLPGSSVHGVLQARILEWAAISFSRGTSQPRIEPGSPTLQADSLPSEPPGKPLCFLLISIFSLGLPSSSAGKESTYNAGDLGLIPGLGRLPGEVKGYPLQYSGLENSMDYIVHGVAKSWT